MTKIVGDVAIQVGADVSDLQQGMRKATRSVDGFDKRAAKMGANIAKVGAAVAVAVGAIAVAAVKMTSTAASAAKEVQNLSNLAGTSAEQFQKYAVASRNVGIEQEKLADIFKDVNDKFGDFAATGQGPLTDFFENIAPLVGVTADQFARLSGPEALQLYVSSLEKAGVSQQQMTFYMEALASDATALIPLLRNGGEQMRIMGDEAQRSGRIMSNEAVAGGAELDRKMTEIAETLRVTLNSAILENKNEILALATTITEKWIPALVSVAEFIGNVVGASADMVVAISNGISTLIEFGETARNALRPTTGSTSRRNSRKGIISDGGGDDDLDGIFDGIFDDYDFGGGTRVDRRKSKKGNIDGGSVSDDNMWSGDPDQFDPRSGIYGDYSTDYERAVELEQQAMQDALDRVQEFLNRKKEIEDEAGGASRAARKAEIDEIAEYERQSSDRQLSNYARFFGSMAQVAATGGGKMAKTAKVLAGVEATLNAYRAASQALADPTVPFYAKAAAYATTLATGLSAVSAIKSTSTSGGGGSGGGGGTTSSGGGTSREATIQLLGGDNFGASQIRDLINAINREQEDGAVVLRVV